MLFVDSAVSVCSLCHGKSRKMAERPFCLVVDTGDNPAPSKDISRGL